MFKKLIVTGAAAALLLTAAAGAFASEDHRISDPVTTVTITNTGSIDNTVNTSSNTGYNVLSATNGSVDGSAITTGDANSAVNLTNQLNFNQFSCGCILGSGEDGLKFTLTNTGSVDNTVNTSSNTGYNVLSSTGSKGERVWYWEGDRGSGVGVTDSFITTGAAASSAVISNVVNTNVFGTTTP